MLPADAGDWASFEAIFERHHRSILAYCLRRTRIEADAEDLTAEAFAVAWRRRRDIPVDPGPWLYGIARRVIANHRRGAGRWERLLDRLRSEPRRTGPGPSGAGLALDALARLSEDDQELLKLVAWEELSHAEIAASLAITTNAVAIRLLRARRRYAQAFAALGGSPMKGSGAGRTSLPVTDSSTGSWRHEDT